MILETTGVIAEQLSKLQLLEQAGQKRQHLADSEMALKKVETPAHVLLDRIDLVSDHLSARDRRLNLQAIQRIKTRLQIQQSSLAQQPYQVTDIQTVEREIRDQNSQLEMQWTDYASKRIQPLLEMLKLLVQLPEARTLGNQLQNAKQNLERAAKFPTNETDLQKHDMAITVAREQTQSVGGLKPTLEKFLIKVARDEATLADITEETLAWCQTGERASIFRIRLKSSGKAECHDDIQPPFGL